MWAVKVPLPHGTPVRQTDIYPLESVFLKDMLTLTRAFFAFQIFLLEKNNITKLSHFFQ